MVNYCVHAGLEKGIASRLRLSNEVYHELLEGGLHTWYALPAIEVAAAMLRNYRMVSRGERDARPPHARRSMAKLGSQGYKVVGD